MPRVNVYLPEVLHARVKRAGLNVSEICRHALEEELRRKERVRALERFVEELDERFGPATADEVAEADAWVEQVVSAAERGGRDTARRSRSRRSRKSA